MVAFSNSLQYLAWCPIIWFNSTHSQLLSTYGGEALRDTAIMWKVPNFPLSIIAGVFLSFAYDYFWPFFLSWCKSCLNYSSHHCFILWVCVWQEIINSTFLLSGKMFLLRTFLFWRSCIHLWQRKDFSNNLLYPLEVILTSCCILIILVWEFPEVFVQLEWFPLVIRKLHQLSFHGTLFITEFPTSHV